MILTEKERKELKLQLRPVVKRMLDEQSVATAIANAMRRNPDLTWSELAGVFCEVMGCLPINCPHCGCGESGALFYRLADLIDRPTCTFYGTPERIGYVCSNCGQTFTRRPLMSHAFGNDIQVEIPFRFCPYCGAEVVTDDE